MLISPKDSILVIILLSSVLLLVTAAGVLLARKFKRYRSRPYLFASFILLAQSFGILCILLTSIVSGYVSAPFDTVLEPMPLISGFLPLFCILIYIVEIKFPGKLNPRDFLLCIIPALLASASLILSRPIHLHMPEEIITEITRPDVLLRLVIVSLYIIYPVAIACIPHDWHHCLISRKMVFIFEVIFILTSFVSVPGLFLGFFPAIIINFLLIMSLNILVVYIEFKIRIPVTEPVRHHESNFEDKDQKSVLDLPEIWMNPDMTATELAKIMGTNHTYLLKRIKSMGYSSYSDMINRKRVKFICQKLDEGQNANIINLMFDAGFRSRSTASREFKRIVGCSPTEYQESISDSK